MIECECNVYVQWFNVQSIRMNGHHERGDWMGELNGKMDGVVREIV